METMDFVWAVLPSLFVGIVMWFWESKQKKFEKEMCLKEENREKGELVKLDLICSTASLAYATAMAVKHGHANGEMDSAIAYYEEAMERFRKYEREQLIKE